uniref:Nuclear receptor n=1 Tax=Pristionchus pacificus TaxID=54126 RepID=A0A8R1Z721_PRIPA
MAAAEEPERCLICEVPIAEMHLGIMCCRACSVFYKRTLSQKRVLRCKEGDGQCILKNPKTTCRKCRYERFSSILSACAEGRPAEDISSDSDSMDFTPSPSCFLDHTTSMQSDSASNETPTFEKMKRAYGVLCLMRKNGEMGTCTTQIYDQLQRGIINFAYATYGNVVPNARIMYTGLLDFFSTSFEDFRNLSKEHQHLFVYGNFDMLNKTDDLYRSVQHFPDCDTLMPSYTTIFRVDRVDEFLVDCPPGVNKEEAGAEFVKNTKRSLVTNKAHFKRVQLDGEEFMALLGLGLWNDNTPNSDDEMIELVKKNRSVIMRELHKHYARKGRTDYAGRLGDLLCLLVNMQKVGDLHKEDEQVYMLMNMFNEYVT